MGNERITPKAFNDLYLPVQWRHDGKNPGVVDPDELWVHPELLAVNAFLKRSGQKPIAPDAFVAIGTNYLTTPPKRRIAHPLLARDLASRKRIRFESDLKDLPDDSSRKTVAELVKAAALAHLYYNLQRNPRYVPQLRAALASGDFVRLRHFWQNGTPECVAVKDPACTSLPGIPADRNGTWWPDAFTLEDILFLQKNYAWKNAALKRKVLTPRSRVVEAQKGEADAFPFKEKWYKPASINSDPAIRVVALMMAERLRSAAAALNGAPSGLSQLLTKQADDLERGPIFGDPSLDQLWVETSDPRITTSFGSVESDASISSPDGTKSAMQGVVAYSDPSAQKYTARAMELMAETNRRIHDLWEKWGESFPVEKSTPRPPKAAVASVIMNSGAMNAPAYAAGGFNQPNHDNYERDLPTSEHRSKLVYFGQIIAARIENQGLAVAAAFEERVQRELADVAQDIFPIVVFTQAHEIAHSLGMYGGSPVEVPRLKQRLKADEVYDREISMAMEEMKADLVGLFALGLHEELGLIDRKTKQSAYRAQIGNLLRDLHLGEHEIHGRAGILTMPFYERHGVITYDAAKQLYRVDEDALERNLPAIVKESLDLYCSFDAKRVRDFDAKARKDFDASPLGKFVARARTNGVAQDNLPYYVVLGKLGAF